MPMIIDPQGIARYIPGVYTDIRVVSNAPGPLPEFQIPMLLGEAPLGHPYNADSLKYAEEPPFTVCKPVGTSAAVATYYGFDSDLNRGMIIAKRHGLPFAYAVCMAALTRTKIAVPSTGPIVQFTLYGRKFGAPINHVRVSAPSGTSIQITGLKSFSMLSANGASGDRRIYVRDNSWVRVGMTLYIGDNDTTDASKVVRSIGNEPDSNGLPRPYVEFTATLGAAFAIADDAIIYELDTANKEISPTLSTVQQLIDWINDNSKILAAHKEIGTFTNSAAVIAIASDTVLKEIATWGTVTVGTSPSVTSSDYTAFITLMQASAWDQFAIVYGLIPQAFCALDSSSTIHGLLRDWAIDKRAEGSPISVVVGTAWGDTVIAASDDTNPIFRARALNSQDMQLCAGGLDLTAAYLSLSPAVWGRRVGGGVNHNLTNDILFYSSVEKQWDERNSGELTSLLRGGVTTYKLSTVGTPGYRIAEGLSTLQQNTQSWNVGTNDTPLTQQRDLADFVDRVFKNDLEGQAIGAEEVDAATVAGILVRRAQRSLYPRNLITAFRLTSVVLNESGTGWAAQYDVRLPITTDFITGVMNIQIGA